MANGQTRIISVRDEKKNLFGSKVLKCEPIGSLISKKIEMSPEIPNIGNSDDIKILSFRNLSRQSSGKFTESISMDAVRIRKAYKSYGKNDLVLYNLDMTVSKGIM